MSHLLWKHFHNEEVERFRQLLSNGTQNENYQGKGYAIAAGNAHSYGSLGGSPVGFATSPKVVTKHRKVSGNPNVLKGSNASLGRAEVNSRDHAGLTILHRAASSTSENAISFALALLEHPAIDLYIQDTENGWTALHRALYFGNIAIARAIIEKDHRNPTTHYGNTGQKVPSSIIKVKDHEGHSPFDVYNATTARRALQSGYGTQQAGSDDGTDDEDSMDAGFVTDIQPTINGDEVFAWGSSRNHGLGFKDQDDRQHPEKITLHRPDHLLFRFYREHLESSQDDSDILKKSLSFPKAVSELPTLISNRPIIIQDVVLSKLHSAILTTDPESNLYMCGFGPGGRLGTGDEATRFSYVPIDDGPLAGKKVMKVALGQNHTLAVTSEGLLLSWGSNMHGQLGYTLPRPSLKDEEPICVSPRQIFGPLKREMIIGVAASTLHSVAHTSTSLFTWGKNEGQLGLMDSDSRSLEVQPIPRKVAASLFKSPISMVSAINSASIVLLTNHTVCVFANYGYNIVKFPLNEGFTNYHLKASALTTQYDSSHISYVTAGGDTIAAISSRGDLFTLAVRSIPTGSTSTTNPSKIKESLTTPQRIWALRKGNWDGIKSAAVTENGSVIVCTQAGAVWQRVKRANVKDAFTGNGSYNRKDFKFQRIPGLTKVVAVRSTTFGVYTAIRKDCDVTRTQISVDKQNLQEDVAHLLSIRDLEASKPAEDDQDTETPRFWAPAIPADLLNPVKRAVLTSPDLEADVNRHLFGQTSDTYDIELATSTSEVRIPVHGFILSRSPVLRKLLDIFRSSGTASVPDLLVIEKHDSMAVSAFAYKSKIKTTIIFQGLDFIALLNLVLYIYTDTVVDVWHFTRHAPPMAFKYRQVRVELMKTAAYLKLTKLESAVRLMTEPEGCMDVDLGLALRDSVFFDDGNAIVELDGFEMRVHSALLCRRCPFFEGLFNGRAAGQWLAGRRQHDSDAVRIDLKHIQPEVFQLVLRYVYADVGTELFDEVVCADIDEFSDLVMDVMAVSNELMLDRLSQICQEVIGRFVNTRNICHLLNAIAPCSVTAFKDSALEYICLQLESMLENRLLNDLDEDLLLELNEVVRENQLNCLPFAKSGRAEFVLQEKYPYLAEDLHEERRRRIGEMIFRATHKDDDGRLSSSYRARVGSLDDMMSPSPSQEKSRKKSKAGRNAPFSPSIRPKDSTVDLMFDMDDDDDDDDYSLSVGSPQSPLMRPTTDFVVSNKGDTSSPKLQLNDNESTSIPNEDSTPLYPSTPGQGIQNLGESLASASKKWTSPALPSTKLDMRDIMAQAASTRSSALSISLSAQKAKDEKDGKAAPSKLSQKERKKQQAMQQSVNKTQSTPDLNTKPNSPWQIASRGPKISLKDVLKDPTSSPPAGPSKSFITPVSSAPHTPRRTASPDTRFSGQQRSSSRAQLPSRPSMQPGGSKSSPIVPHSKSYMAPTAKAEPSLQLSLSDIIGQQTREQEVIKEAVAKKSLQEIQEEQAFQEWWDQESKKAQEEEAARAKASASGSGHGKSGAGRGKGGGRGRGRGRGDGQVRGRGKGQNKGSTT